MAYLTGEAITQADLAALFASGTYTPTLGSMVIGTGGSASNSAKYTFVGFPAGGELIVEGAIVFGTSGQTFPGAGTETFSLPSGYTLIDSTTSSIVAGWTSFVDSSAGSTIHGVLRPNSSTTMRLLVLSVTGTNLTVVDIASTVPFTWASGDQIYYRFVARCTGP